MRGRTWGRDIRAALARRILRTGWGCRVLREGGDPSVRTIRPGPKTFWGLGIVLLSYIVGWPMVGALAWLSVWWENPWIVAVGGPATYGLSHLLFFLGIVIAGADHVRALGGWMVRRWIVPHAWDGGENGPAGGTPACVRKHDRPEA